MNKEVILSALEPYNKVMLQAERDLWKMPQTGFFEWKSHAYLKARFEELGYKLTEAGEIPGFITEIETGRPGPTLCILGEMDALVNFDHPECDKETGAVHACGHHCQVSALIGIAGALKNKEITDALCGKIRLMAVPAEELIELGARLELKRKGIIHYLNGKMEFLRRGLFDGVDLCFYIHTDTSGDAEPTEPRFFSNGGPLGIIAKHVTYTSTNGGNAMYAATNALNAINAIRDEFDTGDEWVFTHPVITEGGKIPNVIPTQAVVESHVRSHSLKLLHAANEAFNRAYVAGALSMGVQMHLQDADVYFPGHYSAPMREELWETTADFFPDNARGRSSQKGMGGTDFANLSMVFPVISAHINGAKGHAHRADYKVVHPEWAVSLSAAVQIAFACRMLENDAARAKAAIAAYEPVFPSVEAFLNDFDSFLTDCDCISYGDGTANVRWKK